MPRARLVVFLVTVSIFGTTTAVSAESATSPSLRQQADAAYEAEDFATCADRYEALVEQGTVRVEAALYNAACCAARAGDSGRALDLLDRLTAEGYRNLEEIQQDEDLTSLHETKRWTELMARIADRDTAFRKRVHPELMRLHEEDQSDRSNRPIDWKKVSTRDAERRQRVDELLASGEAKEAEDFYHAAMVFQHGNAIEDFRRARELTERAIELDPDLMDAKWLYAAATDRWLHRQKKPQIYGTQFRKASRDSPWTLEPLDADAISDEERAAHGVPPLSEARARVEAMNEREK